MREESEHIGEYFFYMRDMTEREHYYRGHRDCMLYLLRCDMLK